MSNTIKHTLTVEQDPNSDELLLTFPQDLMDSAGWKTGDVIIWQDNNDGTWTLIKKS